MATITIRVPDDMHAKIKKKAEELGKSVNGYIADIIAADLQLTAQATKPKDETEFELMNYIATHGYPMTFKQAMARFHLTYQQLYNRYKHLLAGERELESMKEMAKAFEEKGSKSSNLESRFRTD